MVDGRRQRPELRTGMWLAAVIGLAVGVSAPASAGQAVGGTVKTAQVTSDGKQAPGSQTVAVPLEKAGQLAGEGSAVAAARLLLPFAATPDRGSRNGRQLAEFLETTPAVATAFVNEVRRITQTFTGKQEALQAARLADWAAFFKFVSPAEHRTMEAIIAERAAEENRSGRAAWLLTDDYAEVHGLAQPAQERIIFDRSLKHIRQSPSDLEAEKLANYAVRNRADTGVVASVRAALGKLTLSNEAQVRIRQMATDLRLVAPPPAMVQPSAPAPREYVPVPAQRSYQPSYDYERARREREMEEFYERQRREDQRYYEERSRQEQEERRREDARRREDEDRRRIEHQRRIEENSRSDEQRRRMEEERRRAEEQRRAEDQRRAEEQRSNADHVRRVEEDRRRAQEQLQRDAEQRRLQEERRPR